MSLFYSSRSNFNFYVDITYNHDHQQSPSPSLNQTRSNTSRRGSRTKLHRCAHCTLSPSARLVLHTLKLCRGLSRPGCPMVSAARFLPKSISRLLGFSSSSNVWNGLSLRLLFCCANSGCLCLCLCSCLFWPWLWISPSEETHV